MGKIDLENFFKINYNNSTRRKIMKKIVTVALVGMLMVAGVSAKSNKYYDPCNNKVEWTSKEYKNNLKSFKKALVETRAKLNKYEVMIADWSNVDDSDGVNNWREDIQSLANYYLYIVNDYEKCGPAQSDWQDISVKQYEQARECLSLSSSLLQLDSITAGDYKRMLAMEREMTITNLQILERYYGALVAQQ